MKYAFIVLLLTIRGQAGADDWLKDKCALPISRWEHTYEDFKSAITHAKRGVFQIVHDTLIVKGQDSSYEVAVKSKQGARTFYTSATFYAFHNNHDMKQLSWSITCKNASEAAEAFIGFALTLGTYQDEETRDGKYNRHFKSMCGGDKINMQMVIYDFDRKQICLHYYKN